MTRARLFGLFFLVIAFASLYAFTLDDGLRPGELEGGDLITHQYAQVLGRPSNAPGYPLYTMGGWVWFHIGRALLGSESNPIPILSSYSTLWALLALALLYLLLLDVGAPWPIALLASAFYGVTYFFWYYAVTTEQYASSVAWTLAVVYLAFRWERKRRDGYLIGLALLAGIGLAHQLTVLLIIPPLLWFVVGLEPGLLRRPRLLTAMAGAVALPLLSYAFVYVRGAQHPEWRGAGEWASTGDWFRSFISTSQGRGELTWSLTPFVTPEFPALIRREMTFVGLIGGLAGLALIGRRRAVFLYATLGIYLLFSWVDRLGNWYQVIMPCYALLTLGLGRLAALPYARAKGQAGRVVVLGALAALVLYRGVTTYPAADSSKQADDTALAPGWAILADDPPQGALVLGTLSENLALSYLSQIWGARPDVLAVTAPAARAALAAGAPPLAVTSAALPLVPLEVSPDARYSALGRTLAAVIAQPAKRPLWDPRVGQEMDWQHDFGSGLRLAGARVATNRVTGETVLLLEWQALEAMPDWSVSVRLLQGEDEIAQSDNRHPVMGGFPTSRWLPGEVVGEAYAFPAEAAERADAVRIVIYRQLANGSFEDLDAAYFLLVPERGSGISFDRRTASRR
jgi:hypothetical protein